VSVPFNLVDIPYLGDRQIASCVIGDTRNFANCELDVAWKGINNLFNQWLTDFF
jgi:hypothetical protein